MKQNSIRMVAAGVVLALFVSLAGCRAKTPPASAAAVLLAMCETLPAAGSASGETPADAPLGSGTGGHGGVAVYTRASDPAGGGYLSDTLFSALYGEAARGLLGSAGNTSGAGVESGSATAGTPAGTPATPSAAINDAAICLSVMPTPIEMAVFRCSDERGAATAAGLCRARLDTLRRAWADTDSASMVADGKVTVVGSYVLLIISPNPERAEAAARHRIRTGG